MDPFIAGLLHPEAYDHSVTRFEVLETHISWVILTGDFAYKLKKPVNFGFVDFTTLEQRKFCCEEELRLNARMAEDLYLAVKPVYGPRERATFVGDGEPIEFAVQMRQFSQEALLPSVLDRGELTAELIDRLAIDVARFQRAAPVAGHDLPWGTPELVRKPVDENFRALDSVTLARSASEEICERSQLPSLALRASLVTQLRSWCDREFAACRDDFARRKQDGQIREGHGDMHLGNMVLRRDRIEVFDCLEFNPSLRWIDVISEIAFLVMDLADRGRADLGWRFLNRWLEQTGDYAGLRVWAWYYCYRAMVRAKVAALRQSQTDEPDEVAKLDRQLVEYLHSAQRATQPPPPRLVITCGVSGSGKSHWSQQLAAERGWIRIRSDVERKRLFSADSDLYSTKATAATYQHLRELAAMVLRCGMSVIVDATFLKRAQRQPFRELAAELNVPATLIEFTASLESLRQRIALRERSGGDPSDATISVMEQQLAAREPVLPDDGWQAFSIDTDRSDVAQQLLLLPVERG